MAIRGPVELELATTTTGLTAKRLMGVDFAGLIHQLTPPNKLWLDRCTGFHAQTVAPFAARCTGCTFEFLFKVRGRIFTEIWTLGPKTSYLNRTVSVPLWRVSGCTHPL